MTGNDAQTQAVLDGGILPHLGSLMEHFRPGIVRVGVTNVSSCSNPCLGANAHHLYLGSCVDIIKHRSRKYSPSPGRWPHSQPHIKYGTIVTYCYSVLELIPGSSPRCVWCPPLFQLLSLFSPTGQLLYIVSIAHAIATCFHVMTSQHMYHVLPLFLFCM